MERPHFGTLFPGHVRPHVSEAAPAPAPVAPLRKLRGPVRRVSLGLLRRLAGRADWDLILSLALRQVQITVRSRSWQRLTAWWVLYSGLGLIAAMLFRPTFGAWQSPTGITWFVGWGYAMQASLLLVMAYCTARCLARDLAAGRLDELLLTAATPADIALGSSLAYAVCSLWLVAALLPVSLFMAAVGGCGIAEALRMVLTIAPTGTLGVGLGMGWGLLLSFRRTVLAAPISVWWFFGPVVPWIVILAASKFLIALWPLLGLIPFGGDVMRVLFGGIRWVLVSLLVHWNPLFAAAGAGGWSIESIATHPAVRSIGAGVGWEPHWLTTFAALVGATFFMVWRSVEAVQQGLRTLVDRHPRHSGIDFWVHHSPRYFWQYTHRRRVMPTYDGDNPIAAFDMVFGHRVFLHPFFWCLSVLGFIHLSLWTLLVPRFGAGTGTAAVMIPATLAVALMSGGVALSIAYERDQNRWPFLAMLPLTDFQIAAGKLVAALRSSAWLAIVAATMALVMGWRGAFDPEVTPWIALQVLLSPMAMAVVAAAISQATPSLAEAVWRWFLLVTVPAALVALPYPIGGLDGWALPFSPPLMVVALGTHGSDPMLLQHAQTSLLFQAVLAGTSLLVLSRCLRRWALPER